ncbi:MAG: Crp/Fnr family transcriptional regulator [Pseudomonadota bacterium]
MPADISLRDIALLRDLDEVNLAALEETAVTRVYKKNVVVVTQGDDTDSLYLIVSGSVRVYVSDDQGREVTLNTLQAGESFGELALLSDQKRSASILTLQESRFLVISKDDFLNCMAQSSHISRQIIRALIQRVLELTDEVSSLALLDVYGRVRRLLLKEAEDRDDKLYLKRMTHQAIATRVGSSREMVSKILSDLTQGGYISVSKDEICIERQLPSGW